MRKIWNKYTRGILIVTVSVLMASFAYVYNENQIESRMQTKKVVVAEEHIKPYYPAKFTYREVAISEIPQDAIYDLAELEKQGPWYAGEVGLIKGYPVKKSMIYGKKDSPFGTSQLLMNKKDKLHIGVQTDLVRSAGDFIKPGVIVDVYVYIEPQQMGEAPMVITPKMNPNLKGLLVVTRQTTEGVEPGSSENGSRRVPSVAVLEVNEKQAADLVKYQELGKVYLLPQGIQPEFLTQTQEVIQMEAPTEEQAPTEGN